MMLTTRQLMHKWCFFCALPGIRERNTFMLGKISVPCARVYAWQHHDFWLGCVCPCFFVLLHLDAITGSVSSTHVGFWNHCMARFWSSTARVIEFSAQGSLERELLLFLRNLVSIVVEDQRERKFLQACSNRRWNSWERKGCFHCWTD